MRTKGPSSAPCFVIAGMCGTLAVVDVIAGYVALAVLLAVLAVVNYHLARKIQRLGR